MPFTRQPTNSLQGWNTTQLSAPTLDWTTFEKYVAPAIYRNDPRQVNQSRDAWAKQLGWNTGGEGNFELLGAKTRDQFFTERLAAQGITPTFVDGGTGDNAGGGGDAAFAQALDAARRDPEGDRAWRQYVKTAMADPNAVFQITGDRLTNVDGSAASNEGARRMARYQLRDGKLVPVAQYDFDRQSFFDKDFRNFALASAALMGAGYASGLGFGGAATGDVAASAGVMGGTAGSGAGAGFAAEAAGGYIPGGVASAAGGVGTPTATAGYNLGQLAGGLAPSATDVAATAGVMGGTAGSGAGAGFTAGVGAGLAPVVDAVAIPAAGYGTANASLGSALGDLVTSYAGSLGTKDWLQLLSSGYNWLQADKISDRAGSLDPFGAYRPGYARQLADLLADPSKVTSSPGYKESMKAAEQALTRNLAAQGLTGSGTAAEALANFGGTFQDKYFRDQIAMLSGLSGANINGGPSALQADIASMNAQNQIINNLIKILPSLGLV